MRTLLAALLGALALLCAVILWPFLAALVWAVVLAYVTWPGYRLVRRLCGQRATLAAVLLTILVALGLIGPLSWLAVLLQIQVAEAYQSVLAYGTEGGAALPAFVRKIPWLGELLQRTFDHYASDPQLIRQLIVGWAQRSRTELLGVIGNVGRNLAKFLITLVTVFFLYRHGDRLAVQATRVVGRFFGERLNPYFHAAGAMTRAVVYGLLATALAQGALAGLGYWVAGVQAPILLAVLTALLALIPFGTPVIWVSAGDQRRDARAVSAGHARRARRPGRLRAGGSVCWSRRPRGRHGRMARVAGGACRQSTAIRGALSARIVLRWPSTHRQRSRGRGQLHKRFFASTLGLLSKPGRRRLGQAR
jgi:predicted PurR-regulated permease PerM